MEFLPILLPRRIRSFIEMVDWHEGTVTNNEKNNKEKLSSHDEMLTKLDKILKEEPWKLGFSQITYRELKLFCCEATWAAFCQCDHLLWKIPELQKNALIIYNKLKQVCREMGHTCEDQDKLTELVSKDMAIEQAWQSLKFLKDEKIVVSEKKRVFLYNLYKSERDIAFAICNLTRNTPWQLHVDVGEVLDVTNANKPRESVDKNETNDDQPCVVKKANNISDVLEECDNGFDDLAQTPEEISEVEVDQDQVKAIEMICSNPVTVISGKGGCGKTTIVSLLFRYLERMEEEMAKEVAEACKDFENDLGASEEWNTFNSYLVQDDDYTKKSLHVLFTAPIGRAAGLLREKTGIPAYTLYQVLCSFYAWRKAHGENPWKFSTVSVLVVDEGSLVSVQVLGSVLQLLLTDAKLAKLIILGDIRQLPSIDPGNMLADTFESLKLKGWSIELRTNHRAESQLIVDNATRISQQTFPQFDAVLEISEYNETLPMLSPEKKFILVALPSDGGATYLTTVIKALLKKGPGLQDARRSQFIAFRREDCEIINELCCSHYSKHPMRNFKRRLQFQCNDKICATRNAYIKHLLPEERNICTRNSSSQDANQCTCNVCSRGKAHLSGGSTARTAHTEDDRRLCNGEIFFITNVTTEDSPLGTTKLQNLTLKSATPKRLFKS
uniref:DNA helicase B n=1 Tax=Sphenodon punctatus TaxID=8508 RepID=A0A8D0H6Q6_SPHPU